ncbi:MAG TPA: hypothetical protein VHB21_03245 [Minicystis sp.]|nr:hypothetical protein [Minicystis sp.]
MGQTVDEAGELLPLGSNVACPPAIPIDEVADAALAAARQSPPPAELRCDACDARIEGEPAGHGLYVWSRGSELRFEEPPLCPTCATAIGITALQLWSMEEDEG